MANIPSAVDIVIAAADGRTRDRLHAALSSEPDFLVAGEAGDLHGLLNLARRLQPAVLVIDADLPELYAADIALKTQFNGHVVVMISAIGKEQIAGALRLRAHGIVLTSSPPDVLIRSVRGVASGQCWLDADCVAVVMQLLRETLLTDGDSPERARLTPRELDIIAMIGAGHSNRQVAGELSISERTVKHHLTSVFAKLGISSRVQLALFAVSHKLDSRSGFSASPLRNGRDPQGPSRRPKDLYSANPSGA